MPTLIFRNSAGQEQQKELKTELSVGREAGNDVVLEDERLSRRHCRFFVDHDNSIYVEDVGSANGVMVDGIRIGAAVMVEADTEVKIGGHTVKLVAGTGRAKPAMKMTRHVALVEAEEVKRARLAKASPSDTLPVDAPAVKSAPAPAKVATPPPAVEEPSTLRLAAAEPATQQVSQVKPAAPADDRPALRGLTTPFETLYFLLDKPKHVVGREPPAEFVVPDDSISRRHAEIYKIGPRFSVRDLKSANGTFVNDEQVSETTLSPGDVVRFGVVEMTFCGPASAGGPKPGFVLDDKKKRLLKIAGVAAGVLLLGSLVYSFVHVEPPPIDAAPLPESVKDEQDLPKLVAKCRALSDKDSELYNCAEALKVCTTVVALDSTVVDARAAAALCKKELANQAIVKDAAVKLSTSQEEEAIQSLVKLTDKKSASFARATEVFRDAADLIAKRRREDCKGDVAAGRYELALPSCRRVLELMCNRPDGVDAQTLERFQRASKQTNKKPEFTCPPEYAPFQTVMVKPKDEPERKLDREVRILYSYNSRVADGILSYIREGQPKKVASVLKNMSSREPKLKPQLRPIMLSLEVIDGASTQCQGLLLRGDALGCEKVWEEGLASEQKIVPKGWESALASDLGRQLGKSFFAMAKDELAKEHYDKAFTGVYRCFKHDKQNTDCTGAIAQMEREADRRLREEPGCPANLWALATTPPESAIYKRAKEASDKGHCK